MGLGFRFRQGFGTRVRVVVNRAFRFPPTFGVLGFGPSPLFACSCTVCPCRPWLVCHISLGITVRGWGNRVDRYGVASNGV